MKKTYAAIPAVAVLLLIAACDDAEDAVENGNGGDADNGGSGNDESAEVVGGEGELVVVNWGGTTGEAQRDVWYDPFTEATGIEVVDVSPPEGSQLISQVDTNNVEWDVALFDGTQIDQLLMQGGDYLDPIPWDDFDQDLISGIPEEAQHEYGVGAYYWGWAQVYNTEVFDEAPQDWEDFYDTEAFPGARTMPDQPRSTFEAAQMSMGISPDSLYPPDIDASFDRLGEIDPDIATYWSAGAEGAQLMVDEEAVIGQVFINQVVPHILDGAPLDIVWDEAIYSMDFFSVPAGQMSDEVIEFLEFISAPEQQANYSNAVSAGPVHEDSLDFVDDDMVQYMVTHPDNIENAVEYDYGDWWGENRDDMDVQWEEWKLGME
ncbi:ABC transporter substrate-binding protein [Nesterenkonia salmonea]|nr:ABC transporter substrate-binding protein [Nesterenkonia salmonea]